MIIYNVTVKLTWQIADAWLAWMQRTHIPGVMATGSFTSYQFVKLLDIDEEEGPTYAVQYVANSKAEVDHYINVHAPRLRQDSMDRWGDQFIAFRTLMQVVQ